MPVIWKDSDPSDPMYSEGYRSYSPHWSRDLKDNQVIKMENIGRPPSPPSTPLPTALAAGDSPDAHREIEGVTPPASDTASSHSLPSASETSQRK